MMELVDDGQDWKVMKLANTCVKKDSPEFVLLLITSVVKILR